MEHLIYLLGGIFFMGCGLLAFAMIVVPATIWRLEECSWKEIGVRYAAITGLLAVAYMVGRSIFSA